MLIQVQSMTDAVRMKRHLGKKGIRAEVVQSPSSVPRAGCSFSVRVPAASSALAENVAKEAGIRILGMQGSDSG